jgi:predicted PurR-regulated permease PerM
MRDDAETFRPAARVHPRVDLLAAYSVRFIVIAIVGLAVLWLLRELRVVVAAAVIAVILTRILAPIARWLRDRRWRPGLAAITALVGFIVALSAIAAAVTPLVLDEIDSLGPTVEEAVQQIEDWLVEDSPFEVERATLERLRERAGEGLDRLFDVSGETLLDGATAAGEVLTVVLLALILTFFMLREGRRFVAWTVGWFRPGRRDPIRRAADRGWETLAGYLRGVAILGVVEAVIIGLTLLLVGGSLVAPVMLLTFMLAFIPIVGAITAGVIAVLVALVTASPWAAVVVAVVVVVVQQLDNDLLAPVIYGRALAMHPVVILLSLVAGGALFGLGGTILAVPVVAVATNMAKELWPRRDAPRDASSDASSDAASDVPREAATDTDVELDTQ